MRDFKLTRREFVKGCGSAAIVSATGGTLMFADPVDAAVNSYDTVVHLFLRGGLDGLNGQRAQGELPVFINWRLADAGDEQVVRGGV